MSKSLNYKVGVLKRRFKTGKADFEPGTFISKLNAQKTAKREEKISIPLRVGIMGAV